MKRLIFALMVTALLAQTAAALTDEEIYENAFAAAEKSGKPVLILYNMQTTCPICHSARNYVLVHSDTRAVRMNFVATEIQISSSDKRYVGYRGKFTGSYIPFWVLVTPEGEFIDGGDCNSINAPNGQWIRRLALLAASHPPTPDKSRQAAAAMVDEARANFQAGEFAEVAATCEKLKKLWYPVKLLEELNKLRTDLAAEGQKRIAEGDALLLQTKFLEAALAYEKVSRQFGPAYPAGKEAEKKLANLLATRSEIRKDYQAQQRAAEAEQLAARAARLQEAGNAQPALVIYKAVLDRYADTPAAAKAKEAVERLGEVKVAAAAAPAGAGATAEDAGAGPAATPADDQANEAKARSLLSFARNYHAVRKDDKAREKLRECIDAYPKTDAAKEAATLLEQWGLAGE